MRKYQVEINIRDMDFIDHKISIYADANDINSAIYGAINELTNTLNECKVCNWVAKTSTWN